MVKSFCRISAEGPAALACWRLQAAPEDCAQLLGRRPGAAPRLVQVGPRGAPWDSGLARATPQGVELHLHGGLGVARALRGWLLAAGWQEDFASAALSAPSAPSAPEWPSAADAARALLHAESPRAAAAWTIFGRRDAEATWRALLDLAPSARADQAWAWLQHAAWAEALERPPTLVLAGPANAGKSSLFNAWIGSERATVADAPGTTRDGIGESVRIGTGARAWQLRLLDTAGLWDEAAGVDALAVARCQSALAVADRVLWVLDAATPPGTRARAALRAARPGDLFLLHRTDLAATWDPIALHPGPWLEGSVRRDAVGLLRALTCALTERMGTEPPLDAWLPFGSALRSRLRAVARGG
jgi:small GTP-binding protein